MSMKTLELMHQSLREEEIGDAEIKEEGEKLYAKIVKSIGTNWDGGTKDFSISLALHPNMIVEHVVQKLIAKGWKAKHVYNDGYNQYDHLVIRSPYFKDIILKTLE